MPEIRAFSKVLSFSSNISELWGDHNVHMTFHHSVQIAEAITLHLLFIGISMFKQVLESWTLLYRRKATKRAWEKCILCISNDTSATYFMRCSFPTSVARVSPSLGKYCHSGFREISASLAKHRSLEWISLTRVECLAEVHSPPP